jgi:anti-sigma regulatory factor (Ser/Thr protein kinase)
VVNKRNVGPNAKGYLLALAAVVVVAGLHAALQPLLGDDAALLPFILAVLLTARTAGPGPGLLATVAGLLVGWFLFLPPAGSFAVASLGDAVRIILYVLISLPTAFLVGYQREDAQENARLVAELRAAAVRQRRFLREMLASLTGGRFRLCDVPGDLPAPLLPAEPPFALTKPSLSAFRAQVDGVAASAGLPEERRYDLETAVGEAALNAVVHGNGGDGWVRYDPERGIVQVWICDRGPGIGEEALHRAILERGFTTAGTLGHGFFMILKTVDRLYLLTGPHGTTAVLEQGRTAPLPPWLNLDLITDQLAAPPPGPDASRGEAGRSAAPPMQGRAA